MRKIWNWITARQLDIDIRTMFDRRTPEQKAMDGVRKGVRDEEKKIKTRSTYHPIQRNTLKVIR